MLILLATIKEQIAFVNWFRRTIFFRMPEELIISSCHILSLSIVLVRTIPLKSLAQYRKYRL